MAYTRRETHHLNSLMDAITGGNLSLVRQHLSGSLRETTMDQVVAVGGGAQLSPLMYAIQRCPIVHNESDNRYQIMLAILEQCTDLRLQNEASLQAIDMAIYHGHDHVIQALLNRDDSLLTQTNRRYSPLCRTLRGIESALASTETERYASIIEQVITSQPQSVNTPWLGNERLIYPIAFSFSNLPNAVTILLLKKGADPQPLGNAWKSDGFNPHDDAESHATLRICIAKALLKKQLQAYIDRIDGYGDIPSKFRFFTFPLFKTSRGLNREINYNLAKQLQDELNLDGTRSIRDIFELAEDKRKTIITTGNYSTREGYRAVQKIGSPELREIVKAGMLAGEERMSDEKLLVNAQGRGPSY